MKHFEYKRLDGSVSERFAVPIGYDETNENPKLHTIDLTQFEPEEREYYEKVLHDLRIEYINGIKDAGLGTCFRYFILDMITEL